MFVVSVSARRGQLNKVQGLLAVSVPTVQQKWPSKQRMFTVSIPNDATGMDQLNKVFLLSVYQTVQQEWVVLTR